MLFRNQFFSDKIHALDTDIRRKVHFQQTQIQTTRRRDLKRQNREGYCDQQLNRFLKLTPLLQVLVTRRYFASCSSQDVCSELTGAVQYRLVQSLPSLQSLQSLISDLLWGALRYPTDFDFHGNPIPLLRSSFYGVCHCLIVGQ